MQVVPPSCGHSAAIVYATKTGRTKKVAEMIRRQLTTLDYDVLLTTIDQICLNDLRDFNLVISGTPTYGIGELPREWVEFAREFSPAEFSNSNVAIFCVGDQKYHAKTFGNGLRLLYEIFSKTSANLVGFTEFIGYTVDDCPPNRDGLLPGLLIDQVSQRNLTPERIEKWARLISDECQ